MLPVWDPGDMTFGDRSLSEVAILRRFCLRLLSLLCCDLCIPCCCCLSCGWAVASSPLSLLSPLLILSFSLSSSLLRIFSTPFMMRALSSGSSEIDELLDIPRAMLRPTIDEFLEWMTLTLFRAVFWSARREQEASRAGATRFSMVRRRWWWWFVF